MQVLQAVVSTNHAVWTGVLHKVIFLETCFATLGKKFIASCRRVRHVTCCILELQLSQLAVVSKKSLQFLQNVEQIQLHFVCPIVSGEQVGKQVAQRTSYTL